MRSHWLTTHTSLIAKKWLTLYQEGWRKSIGITRLCKRALQITATYWFCQHTVKYEWMRTWFCCYTLCKFLNVSTNEKWLKGCCSGIWQAARNSLLIKPPTPLSMRQTWVVIQCSQRFGFSVVTTGRQTDRENLPRLYKASFCAFNKSKYLRVIGWHVN